MKTSWDILGSRKPSNLSPVRALAKWCEIQAQLQVRKGQLEDAAAVLQQAVEHRREGVNRSCDPSPHAFAALARDLETLAEIRNKTGDLQAVQQALAQAQAIWEKIHLPTSGPKTTARERSTPGGCSLEGGGVPGLAEPVG